MMAAMVSRITTKVTEDTENVQSQGFGSGPLSRSRRVRWCRLGVEEECVALALAPDDSERTAAKRREARLIEGNRSAARTRMISRASDPTFGNDRSCTPTSADGSARPSALFQTDACSVATRHRKE